MPLPSAMGSGLSKLSLNLSLYASLRAMKVQMGGRCVALLILNLDASWGRVVDASRRSRNGGERNAVHTVTGAERAPGLF